jgi:hypothetical protein
LAHLRIGNVRVRQRKLQCMFELGRIDATVAVLGE